ncbi:MAG: GyrI-like domain-containing protein [Flavobacteriales bacterium]|nr:GyrI-like domain-containing protein [Flavobacteriales bacterium]
MNTAPSIVETEEQPTAVIHLVIPGRDMSKYMDPAIQEMLKTLSDQGMQPVGPMFSYHHRRPTNTFDFELGFPVTKAIKPTGRVVNGTLPAERVVRSVYQGPYEALGDAWGELQAWVREQKLPESGRFWERYLTNPNDVKDAKDHRTELNWVVGG